MSSSSQFRRVRNPGLAKRISPREQGRSSLQRFSAVAVQNNQGIPHTYRTESGSNSGFPGSNPRRRVSDRRQDGPSQHLKNQSDTEVTLPDDPVKDSVIILVLRA